MCKGQVRRDGLFSRLTNIIRQRPGSVIAPWPAHVSSGKFPMQRHIVVLILWLMPFALRMAARRFPSVREHLGAGNWVIQLRLRDNSLARQLHFKNGTVSARWGVAPK